MEKQKWYFRFEGRNKVFKVTEDATVAAHYRGMPQWSEISQEYYDRFQEYLGHAWVELTEFAKSNHAALAAPPAAVPVDVPDAGVADVGLSFDDMFTKMKAWALNWEGGNYITVDELNQGTRALLKDHEALRTRLAAETARADALARAVEPFAGDYHNWLTDNREETYLEYLNRMCDSDNVAISAALAYKLLHGNEAQQDASDGGKG